MSYPYVEIKRRTALAGTPLQLHAYKTAHHIALWTFIVGRHPDRINAEIVLKIIERRDDAVKVADSLVGV